MLTNDIKEIGQKADGKNQYYIRNLIKEEIQNYVLNFVYQDAEFQNLIFTGGTCLRKLYGLDRLSEDLDFDYTGKFDIKRFLVKVKKYFVSQLQYDEAEYKISGNGQTLVIKLPTENVFVRCDFSHVEFGSYGLNKGMITAGRFRFLVNAYDLETMFANKIVAFLKRIFYKGKFQKLPFKGRDIYDLFWFLQLSARSGYNLKPNHKRLMALIGNNIAAIKQEIKDKIAKVDAKFVFEDMLPLVESDVLLREFLKEFSINISKQIDMVM